MKVSVIVPLHDGERFIERALASVERQTHRPLEVLVVDDGSHDAGANLAAGRPGVEVIRQSARGPGAARNTGIRSARGEWIAFLDQDDVWLPAKLETQLRDIARHADTMVSVCRQQWFLEPGVRPPAWLREDLLESDSSGHTPSTLLVRPGVFERVGLFDESLRLTSDVDWFFRLRDRGIAIRHCGETLVLRGIHELNQSRLGGAYRRELASVVRASLRRRASERAGVP